MRWGILFSVPATYEADLWTIPRPSFMERGRKWDGTEMINVLYHFQYSPQSWQEWQRVAAIKVQIEKRVKRVKFKEYESGSGEGKIYTVSELGSHFKDFVKFPPPLYPGKRKEAYKMLCRHAKRLHYEGLLHIEQLIATSIRFNETDPEGITQTVKRAKAAYRFAEEQKDEWKVKLNTKALADAHRKGADKTNQIKRDKAAQKKERARSLKDQGFTLKDIAKELEVSLRTVNNYLE